MGAVNQLRLALVEVIRYELESNHDRDGNSNGMHVLDEDASVMADAVMEVLPKTDDGAADAAQVMGGSLPPAVSSSPAGPGPDKTGGQPGPASFQMIRHHDVTGVSGTGLIGEGTQFRDGTTVFRWYGEHPSTSVWPSVDELVAVHGHHGATELRWLDGGA